MPKVIAVFGASVKLPVTASRSLLPPGVVKSKLSVRFEAVSRLPMVKLADRTDAAGGDGRDDGAACTAPEIEPPAVPLVSVPPLG